ncbi:MAG: indoleacetamide hydrolase [Sedimenticola sp.]|nr:indoleacetamide hydrolase [Sedimenticola sp.]
MNSQPYTLLSLVAVCISSIGTTLAANTVPTTDHVLIELSVTEAAEKIRRKEITSTQLTQALYRRIEANKQLNAFITLDKNRALEKARQADRITASGRPLPPLHGIPLVLKDNIDAIGWPTTAGTPGLLNNYPGQHAPVVDKLIDAGAFILGKNNMHELAFGITSDNTHFGSVGNPYNALMTPGGSSGGTAAAIAARMAPAGLGTDTGGSVRIPPALTGTVGFRPTVGRYSQAGIVPISHTRDTAGPITRTVEDTILINGIITDGPTQIEPADLKTVRLGVPRDYFYQNLDNTSRPVIEEALNRLKEQGVTLVAADLPGLHELNEKIGFPLAIYEVLRDIPKYLDKSQAQIAFSDVIKQLASPDVKFVLGELALGKDGKIGTEDDAIPTQVYQEAVGEHRAKLQTLYQEYFAKNNLDGMLFPTTLLPARRTAISAKTVDLNGQQVPTFQTYIHNTDPSSNAGIPGITLPIGMTSSGLPIGLELDGPADSDEQILAIALSIESLFEKLPAPHLSTGE